MTFMDIKTALTILLAMAKRAPPAKDQIQRAGEKEALRVVTAYRKTVSIGKI